MLGRGVTQIDDALSQDDTARGAIGKIDVLCLNLRGEPQRVRGARTGNLQLGTSLAGQRLCDIIRGWRKQPKLGMDLREIVQASREAPKLASFDQAGERLVDRRTSSNTQEITGRKNAAAPTSAGTLHNLIRY